MRSPLAIGALVSLAAHLVFMALLAVRIGGEQKRDRPRPIALARIDRHEKPAVPPREEPKPEPKKTPPRLAKKVVKAPPEAPKKEEPKEPDPTPPPEPPKVGMSEDQVSANGGMAVATGATLEGEMGTGRGERQEGVEGGVEKGRGRGSPRPVPIYAVTRLPRPRRLVEPEVPSSFRESSREVVVVVEVEIDSAGRVTSARVVKKAGFGLDEAVLSAARSTEFEPALVGSEPVAVRYQIPYRIRVRG